MWDPHLTLDLRIVHFRFRHAVDVAIRQVGMFSLCYIYVFICFCNHSSRSDERKDINLCSAAFIDPRENFTTILRTDGLGR